MSLHEHKAVFGKNFSVPADGAEKFGRASLLQLNRERLLRTHTLRHPQASMSSAGASVLELAGEQPVLLPASESPVAPTPSTRRRSGAQSARRPQSARQPKAPAWNVSTRKNASQWADSILPPSPRTAMQQEVGHKTSFRRRPQLSKSAKIGAIAPPPMQVMSSDCVNSPRDWMVHRATAMNGYEMPGSFRTHLSRESSRSPFSASDRRRLAEQAIARVNAQRERAWDPSPSRSARAPRAEASPPLVHTCEKTLASLFRVCLRPAQVPTP